MVRKTHVRGLALLLVAGLTLAACANTEEKLAAESSAAQEAKWAELQQMKQALDAKRAELAAARDEMRAALTQGGSAAAPALEPLEMRVRQLEVETQQLADEFNTELVSYINANPPVEGEPRTERQEAAMHLKSSEDMLYAEEYIEQGGDYSRAIDIYNAALAVDPDNAELQEALARAESQRYMSEERFTQVKKGMTAEQVRDTIGAPFHRNIREFPQDVVAWFYPTDPRRSAAAVWFKQRPDGRLEVYKVNYREVEGGGPVEAAASDGQAG
jgi:tetratricopeptide (TPR) repeat protein